MIEVAPRNSTVDAIDQVVHPVDRERKRALLSTLIRSNAWRRVLVFTRTKHGADRLAKELNGDGIQSLAIHGNKSQNTRTRALAEFRGGGLTVLVATDIAARGLDIDALPRVVNYDLPHVPEDYVHRIGRTGRAGAPGEAVSLVCVDEHALLRGIERLIRRPIRSEPISGFEPDPRARPQPIARQPARGQQRRASARPGVQTPERGRSAGRQGPAQSRHAADPAGRTQRSATRR
jgi:ATP-dependent RNA helicase RhlE